MPLPVKLQEVIDALEVMGDEMTHYLNKLTGEVVLVTDEQMSAAEKSAVEEEDEDEARTGKLEDPAWWKEAVSQAREVLETDHFVALPDKFEIHEYQIMEDFCLSFKGRDVGEDLLRSIKGKGAFGRFKHGIYSLGVEKAWFQFRQEAFERIAIEWLEREGIPYERDDAIQVSGAAM